MLIKIQSMHLCKTILDGLDGIGNLIQWYSVCLACIRVLSLIPSNLCILKHKCTHAQTCVHVLTYTNKHIYTKMVSGRDSELNIFKP